MTAAEVQFDKRVAVLAEDYIKNRDMSRLAATREAREWVVAECLVEHAITAMLDLGIEPGAVLVNPDSVRISMPVFRQLVERAAGVAPDAPSRV